MPQRQPLVEDVIRIEHFNVAAERAAAHLDHVQNDGQPGEVGVIVFGDGNKTRTGAWAGSHRLG